MAKKKKTAKQKRLEREQRQEFLKAVEDSENLRLKIEHERLAKQVERLERQRQQTEHKEIESLRKQGYSPIGFGKTLEKEEGYQRQIEQLENLQNLTEHQKKLLKQARQNAHNYDKYKHSSANFLGTQSRDRLVDIIKEVQNLGIDTSRLDDLLFSNTAIYMPEFVAMIEKETNALKEEIMYRRYQDDIERKKAERLLNAINSIDFEMPSQKINKASAEADKIIEDLKRKYNI